MALRLKGMPKVLGNLNKELKGIKKRSLKGLIRAQIIVRRAMDKERPMIPIDWGNLRASWFVVTNEGGVAEGHSASFRNSSTMVGDHKSAIERNKAYIAGNNPSIIMGFSAHYAIAVHENIGATFKKEGAGAKFFEVALQRHSKEMLEVITKEAKIK